MSDNEAVVERVRGLNLTLRKTVRLMDSHRHQISFTDVDRKQEWNEVLDQLKDAEQRSTGLLAEVVEDARQKKREERDEWGADE
jgi:hypothetical protein